MTSLQGNACCNRKSGHIPPQSSDAGPSTKRAKIDDNVDCDVCNLTMPRREHRAHLRTLQHKLNIPTAVCEDGVELFQEAFECRIASYRIKPTGKEYIEVKEFMQDMKEKVLKQLKIALDKHGALKVNLQLFGLFLLPNKQLEHTKSFNTKNKQVEESSDLEKIYSDFTDAIANRCSTFEERDSGWTLKEIQYLEVHINKFNPLKASSYIDLPKTIKQKKAIINVQNSSDQECFKWAILSALHPAERDPERVARYKEFENELNFEGIKFPVKLKDVSKFEEANNISVNVYGLQTIYEKEKVCVEVIGPLYFTKERKNQHVNLLVVDNDDGDSHYCWIKNMQRLIGNQLSKHHGRKFLCDGCLIYFYKQEKLKQHQEFDCRHIRANLPLKNKLKKNKMGKEIPENILQFESFEKKLKVPFVVYADFESLLQPIQSCEPSANDSFSVKTHVHSPYSFAYYIKCSYDDSLSKFETYRGLDCAEVFNKQLELDIKRIYNDHLKIVLPMRPLSEQQKNDHRLVPNCHICEEPFTDSDERICDHDHLSGMYRGPAHKPCNLNYKTPTFVPIFFHNLSNYDAHLFIKALGADEAKIDVIAQNIEKYISFSKHIHVDTVLDKEGKQKQIFIKMRFLDSFRFMPMKLDSLAKNLKNDQCVEVKNFFPNTEQFNLIRQKGVFPYVHVDDFDKLNETMLPSQEDFYNTLTEEEITDTDYARAHVVWKMFDCKTLGSYSDIYLKSDVLLLADIFEIFRKVCLTTYNLDPCQFFTAPGLSWAAMLKYTKVELELFTDVDMLHFIQNSIRGGIAQCAQRKAIANNKYIPHYDSFVRTSFINYLDATNLYGAAMSQPLPLGGFKWLSDNEIEQLKIDMEKIPNDNEFGFILEVDLEYPPELHDWHNDLPFCAENIIPTGSKLPKLIPNLNDKFKYVIHYRNLQQALTQGLKLKHIHRVLKFRQSAWLKQYVDLNTNMRNQAKNKFEKEFYKLMNNSVYGKTMENVEKRTDIKLVTHWKNKRRKIGAENLIAKPQFKCRSIFSSNLVAIHMKKLKITYDKPICIGFSVLEISKLIIYEFFYNVIKKQFGHNVHLLYTDTDSLILQTFTDDFYDHMKENLNEYDTSNFSEDNQFKIPVNKSVVGKMKDEYAGKIIWEFYGTGAKAYIDNVEGEFKVDGKTTKRAKGVKSSVVEKELSVEDYRNAVENDAMIFKKMNTFRSYKHQLYTETQNKVALCSGDDKRFIIPNRDGKTLAWGNYRIKDFKNIET